MRVCPKDFVRDYSIHSFVCSISGGKDSLAMTHYCMNELEGIPSLDLYVIHADTGCMLPSVTPFLKDVCSQFGWNLHIVYGNFFEHVQIKGMPSMFRRWCCGICKLNPIHEFVKNLRPQRAEATGLMSNESERRKRMKLPEVFYLKKSWVWKYAPILSWSEKDVLSYMKKHDLPMPPHYRLGLKETCMCGAFNSKKQMMILKAVYPELFQKFVDIEKTFKSGGACFYFNNKPTYAKDLAKQTQLLEMSEK